MEKWKNANGNLLMMLNVIMNQNVVANGFFSKELQKRMKWNYAHFAVNHYMSQTQHYKKINLQQ